MRLASKFQYHFTYKTTCTITGRYYFGMHSTNVMSDSYLGSGELLLRSIEKHGVLNHSREIIEMFQNRNALSQAEVLLITKDHLSNALCMNLMPGGSGGCRSSAQALKISLSLTGRKLTISHRNALRMSHLGVPRSVQTCKRISCAKKNIALTKSHVKALIEGKLQKRKIFVEQHDKLLQLRQMGVKYKQITLLIMDEFSEDYSVQKIKSVVNSHKIGKCRTCNFHKEIEI